MHPQGVNFKNQKKPLFLELFLSYDCMLSLTQVDRTE